MMKSFFASRYVVLFLSLSGIVLSASRCQHHHSYPPDGIVIISILSPSENIAYPAAQSVRIDAVLEGELHGYSAVVTNPENGQKVFNYESHSHVSGVRIDTTFKVNATTATELLLTVEATDHDLKKTNKKVRFKVQP